MKLKPVLNDILRINHSASLGHVTNTLLPLELPLDPLVTLWL